MPKKTSKEQQIKFLESLAGSKARRELFLKDPVGILEENEIELEPEVIKAFAEEVKEELDKICPPTPKPFPYPPRPWPIPQPTPWPGSYGFYESSMGSGIDPTIMNAAVVSAAAAVVSAAAAVVTAVTALTADR